MPALWFVNGALFWRPFKKCLVFGTCILFVGLWFVSNNTAVTTFTMKNPKMQTQTKHATNSEWRHAHKTRSLYSHKAKEKTHLYNDYRMLLLKTTKKRIQKTIFSLQTADKNCRSYMWKHLDFSINIFISNWYNFNFIAAKQDIVRQNVLIRFLQYKMHLEKCIDWFLSWVTLSGNLFVRNSKATFIFKQKMQKKAP